MVRTRKCVSLAAMVLLMQPPRITPLAMLSSSSSHQHGRSGLGDSTAKRQPTWTDRLRELLQYKEEQGHTLVPKRYPENQGLANWVSKQRQLYKKYQANDTNFAIDAERIRILDKIGFCWETSKAYSGGDESSWWVHLEELKKLESFSENVPRRLRSFLEEQRIEYEKVQNGEESRLDDRKLAALNELDSSWWKSPKGLQSSWTDRVHELIQYKEEHGNTLVPKRYPSNQGLANWVSKQRQLYRKFQRSEMSPSALDEDRFRILDRIGFCWDTKIASTSYQDQSWWSRFDELKKLDSISEGVPPELGLFLRKQRLEYEKLQNGEKSRLDDTKLSALAELDPLWWKSPRERQWEARFQSLVEYKKRHGNCCVPVSTYPDRKLANWVSNMRKRYKNREKPGQLPTLTDKQVERLNSIGFVWDHWDHKFDSNFE
mmetsp:Transcript_82067/g.237944  ORF Transcript_82067/g.237944 Transcript_82067/m.237944 type:complete len:431 (-) Transcript_82067:912-2204(-)